MNNPILNDSSEHDADCGGRDCYDAPRQTTDSWWAQAISYVSMTFYPILSKLAFVTSAVTPVSSYAHEEKQYIENYKPLGVEVSPAELKIVQVFFCKFESKISIVL